MLTVMFATHNGARRLPRVLEAFAGLQPPAGGWKLVAIDNASTDATPTVLASFSGRLPITVLHEPGRGKNRALNAGLPAIDGDLVVLTDDDVLPAADWLVQLRACADANPDYDIFGGAIRPRFELQPPAWLLQRAPLDMAYAATDPQLPASPVSPGLVWGPNMAVRSRVFDAGHRFDVSVGPNGASYAMGSETEYTRRLARLGYVCWFCPRAVVEHMVRAEQITPRWLYARAVRGGRGEYLHELTQGRHRGRSLAGVPLHLYRRLLGGVVQMAVAAVRVDRGRWFSARIALAETLGKTQQARALANQAAGAGPPAPDTGSRNSDSR